MANKTIVGILLHLRDQVPDFQTYLNQITIEAETLGATHLVIVDQTRFHIAQYFQTNKLTIDIFDTLEAAEETYRKNNKIYLEPQRNHDQLISTSLTELKHPKNCLYITGPDTGTIPTNGRQNATWVHIPMATESGVFYAPTALVLTLYDRLVKKSNSKEQNAK